MVRQLITVDEISRSFGAVDVLKDISFNVDEGDRIGVVGHNGSGKTTLLNTISNRNQDLGDIEFNDGGFIVAGTDRSMTLIDAAKAVQNFMTTPPGMEVGLSEWAAWSPPAPTFPNGCHVCEVEIDRDTGALDIVRYAAVDDVGTVINPLLMIGQLHGGIVQGVGQAMLENVVWDRNSGQLVSGSFMDYTMPRADDLPSFEMEINEVPTSTNPMGVKGAGEAGCVGALPAVMNAIVDALRPLGVTTLDMPATTERVWRAMQEKH